MDNKTFLLIAVVAGVIAAAGVFMFLWSQSAKITGGQRMVPVLYAKKSILQNDQIGEGMVEVRPTPERYRQPGALTQKSQAVNLFTMAPIKSNEQITDTKLREVSITELASRLPPGKRAVTIGVSKITGVSEMVRPGNRVDILTTYNVPQLDKDGNVKKGTEMDIETRMWRENVEVVAVGEQIEEIVDAGGKPASRTAFKPNGTVTVALEAQDAVQLAILQNKTDVTLLLRSAWESHDTLFAKTNKVTLMNVIGYKKVTPADSSLMTTSDLFEKQRATVEEMMNPPGP